MRRPPIRARIALTYAGLFLVAGGALVGITYGLVAHSLTSSPRPKVAFDPRQAQYCKAILAAPAPAPKTQSLPPVGKTADSQAKCKALFSEGAQAGAADQRAQSLHQLLVYALLGLAGMTAASGGLGWLLAGRALAPVRTVTAAARRISVENLDERLALDGPHDEVRDLADTFDAMLARLASAFDSQLRFVGNASHELRTPLTIMRTELEVTLDNPESSADELRRMGSIMRQAVGRAERLVDALLELATTDAGLARHDLINLEPLVATSVHRVEPQATSRSISIRSELADVAVTGDEELIGHLTDNLLDNAVIHNHDGGWAHVSLNDHDGKARLVVSNSGPVVPSDQVGEMFQPFRRLETPRVHSDRGVGLGLSIVSAIVSAHDGSVTAIPRPGGGLEVVVELPVASTASRSQSPPHK